MGVYRRDKAPPGTYQARLTANGVTQTKSFSVLPDPRIPEVSQEDYQAQFGLAVQVRDSLDAVQAAFAKGERSARTSRLDH